MLGLFLGVILASVMVLNFKTATEFVQNQIYTDAKNTAHSLGLSISKVADPKDTVTMGTMIDAIFDSGYHQQIVLKNIDGKVIYRRNAELKVHDVPQWFINMVPIRNASASSDIMMGWSRFGTLQVSGHTGHAYRQLYLTFIDLLETFVMLSFAVFIGLYLLLSFSLKSLSRIRDQAIAIIDNEFIIEKKIPFTTEFRSVTVAMNAMVAKVKDIFERENETLRRYHELLYKDTETKLYNRRYLTTKLPDYLQSDASLSTGVYVIFSMDEIDRLKREKGYEHYSSLLNTLAGELNAQLGAFRNALIARLNESDFFAVLPACDISSVFHQVERLMETMHHAMDEIDPSIASYVVLGCGVGIYNEHDRLKTLFSRADYSVVQAKSKGNFTIEVSHEHDESLVLGREEWRHELLQSLEESRMVLAFQSVVEQRGDALVPIHEEIFLRLLDKEGIIHSAGYFLPVAMNLGIVDTLDRYGIEKVLGYIKERQPMTPPAINVSGEFIKKYANLQWLRMELETFARRSEMVLWFEVSNTVALHEVEEVRTLCAMVKMFGYRFGIDHFTIPEEGAFYLQAIRPDYVKSSAAYLQDIMVDKNTGQKSESFNNLVRSLGISVIAMNIEDAKDLENVRSLGIERFQGAHIAPVGLLK